MSHWQTSASTFASLPTKLVLMVATRMPAFTSVTQLLLVAKIGVHAFKTVHKAVIFARVGFASVKILILMLITFNARKESEYFEFNFQIEQVSILTLRKTS